MKSLTISIALASLIIAAGCGVLASHSPQFTWSQVLQGEFKHPHSKFSD